MNTDDSHFEMLLEIHREIGFERDMKRLPGLVMESVSKLMNADRSSLFLFDRNTMLLRAHYAQGVEANSIVVPLHIGLIGTALLKRCPINLTNANQHPFFNHEIDCLTGHKTDSLLAVPIFDATSGNVLGGLELLNKPSGRFTTRDEGIAAKTVRKIAQMMASGEMKGSAAREMIETVHHKMEFGRGAIFQLDQETGYLTALHADGVEGVDIKMNMRLGIAGLVVLTEEPLLISDAQSDPRFDSSYDSQSGYVTREILCVPLLNSEHEAMGVIQVINKHKGCFTHYDLEMLNSIAGVIAVAIDSAMQFEESELQFRSLLDALAASIDARDTLTAGHSRRVAEIARGVALELEFSESDIDLLEVAAILHDYGKIGVEDQVLKKPGSLNKEEFAHMRQHADFSYDILNRIRFSRRYGSVPLIAASHHENIDGSGYPRGLKGYEIPFMAKILAVADVFEALTADRHYRKGMPIEQAMEIIEQDIDKKFERRVVDALQRFLSKRGTWMPSKKRSK